MGANIAATVVASGSIFFYESSQNTGDVTSAGCTHFNDESVNNGVVNGCAEFNGGDADPDYQADPVYTVPPARAYITSDPPLVATWQTNGPFRRVVIQGTRNADQLQAIGASVKTFYGKWQACPPDGCWTNPASYRPLAPCDYVLDFAGHPNYEVE